MLLNPISYKSSSSPGIFSSAGRSVCVSQSAMMKGIYYRLLTGSSMDNLY